jgi:hypothetical protein
MTRSNMSECTYYIIHAWEWLLPPSTLFMPLDVPVILKLNFAPNHDSHQRLSPATACKTLHIYRLMLSMGLSYLYHGSKESSDIQDTTVPCFDAASTASITH